MTSKYTKADGTSLTVEQLSASSDAIKLEVMRQWFDEHFDDPADCAPWDGADGGYQIPEGGSDAEEVLAAEFESLLGLPLVQQLAAQLNDISAVWVDKSLSEPDEE